MSFDFAPETGSTTIFNACIKVIGVGGGGGNAVEHMIDKKAQGITFIAANTDQQALNRSRADIVIPLGKPVWVPVPSRKWVRRPLLTLPNRSANLSKARICCSSRPVWAAERVPVRLP